MTVDKQDVKLVVAAISAAVAAFTGSQALSPKSGLSRDDVTKIVQTESPYSVDRAYIYSQLTNNKVQLSQIQKDLATLRVSQARVEVKIDLLLRRKK